MAYLAPSDLPALALSGGWSAELDTLNLLRRSLSSDYTVFHGVHWSRDWRSVAVFGEADFIVVNNAGAALVIEQKSGGLEETVEGLFKTYDGNRKDVARQKHSTPPPAKLSRRSRGRLLHRRSWTLAQKTEISSANLSIGSIINTAS
jgi:hypothetical protein